MCKFVFCIAVSMMVAQVASAQGDGRSAPYPQDSNQQERVQLYPRPATEFLVVKFKQPHARLVKLAVRSLIGTLVKVEREREDDYEVQLKLVGLPPGYYFLSIKNEEAGWSSTYRFLKR